MIPMIKHRFDVIHLLCSFFLMTPFLVTRRIYVTHRIIGTILVGQMRHLIIDFVLIIDVAQCRRTDCNIVNVLFQFYVLNGDRFLLILMHVVVTTFIVNLFKNDRGLQTDT